MIVTGDRAGAGHEFAPGTQGVVAALPNLDGVYRIDGPDDYWWVFESDLTPAVDPVPVVAMALHSVPDIECDHLDGKAPSCERDAQFAVDALREIGLLA